MLAGGHGPMNGAFRHCETLVREADKDRFLATLFAPADRRAALHVLYAFNVEIARIAERIHQPLAGEVRLQWWREVLEGGRESGGHPVASALGEVVARYRIKTQSLLEVIDARSFDLYEEPMRTVAELEDYARRTSCALIALGQHIIADSLDGGNPTPLRIAEAGGIAWAITSVLRELPIQGSRGQRYVPEEILARHGARRDELISRKAGARVSAALADLRRIARDRLASLRDALEQVPGQLTAAILPVALVPLYLKRMDRCDDDPFRSAIDVPQWIRQWALWRAANDLRRISAV